jgi:hypothetical protein
MQTVIETSKFLSSAEACGMTEQDRLELVCFLAENPKAGDVIAGTGGCRKLRMAGRGKGKSGGFRVITFYSGESIPLFLLTTYSKGNLDNLSHAERNAFRSATRELVESYAPKKAHRRR